MAIVFGAPDLPRESEGFTRESLFRISLGATWEKNFASFDGIRPCSSLGGVAPALGSGSALGSGLNACEDPLFVNH
jgi:hypothetical protein